MAGRPASGRHNQPRKVWRLTVSRIGHKAACKKLAYPRLVKFLAISSPRARKRRRPGLRADRTTAPRRGAPARHTTDRLGEMLGISRRSAYRAVARGDLPTLRLGRRILVPTPRLLALLGAEIDVSDADTPKQPAARIPASVPPVPFVDERL